MFRIIILVLEVVLMIKQLFFLAYCCSKSYFTWKGKFKLIKLPPYNYEGLMQRKIDKSSQSGNLILST